MVTIDILTLRKVGNLSDHLIIEFHCLVTIGTLNGFGGVYCVGEFVAHCFLDENNASQMR